MIRIDYAQFCVVCGDTGVEPGEHFAGQANGLSGAAVPGVLALVTGLSSGDVHLRVERHDGEPAVDDVWEDIVEVSFTVTSSPVAVEEWDGDCYELDLPVGTYRVRYCARGMDEAHDLGTLEEGEPVDSYLLQAWPARAKRDRILKQTSDAAARLHPAPLPAAGGTDREAKAAAKAAAFQQRQRKALFGDRVPNDRLAAVGGQILSMSRLDRDFMFALSEADDTVHRAVARWAALQAMRLAGMTDLPMAAPAVQALHDGSPLPPPFTSEDQVWKLLADALPHTTVPRVRRISADDDDSDVVQQWCAAQALAATLEDNSLQAAIDAVAMTGLSYGPGYEAFLGELRAAFPHLRQ